MAEWKKVVVSGSVAELENHYNGEPTINPWSSGLDGSYFGTFSPTTYTSDILRFIAGLLSASAPAPSPNTRTFASISETITNSGTGTVNGYIPQNFTGADLTYLISQGFASVGGSIFPGRTVYNNSSFNIVYSSVAGGSTTITSSADAQLFGLGTLSDVPFRVSGAINWFYSDNNSETVIATSQSQALLSLAVTGSSGGLTLGRINTSNPLVIPPAFQDGKFANVFSSGLFNNGRSFTNISSSGWYHISASIRINSGSSAYTAPQTATERIFYAPTSTINTSIGNNSLSYTGGVTASLTATSRSLSGAPYLLTATWTQESTASGFFAPLYSATTAIADLGASGTGVTLSGATSAASTAGGTVQTANTIFDSTGTTPRSTGTVPFIDDIIKLSGSISFNAGSSGTTNIQQGNTLSPSTFTVATRGRDRNGNQSTLNTQTYFYHSAGTFGQPLASGSMGYYGRAQAYDAGTLTGGSETFVGENFRLKIDNNALSGSYSSGGKWITGSYDAYSLGALDLQVKPGFLVRPGGSYGYWLADPNSGKTYKYYARAFRRDLATAATSMTVNVGRTLVGWNSATSGTSVALIFASNGAGVSATPGIYDISNLTDNVINASVANDDFINPFSRNITLYGNSTGALNSTTYTVPLKGGSGMALDNTYRDLIVLVRYTGDQAPITSIAVTYS